MSSKPTQDQRIAELMPTALGKDKLVLTRLDVSEGLSELFEIRVECVSEDEDLDLGQIIGKEVSVRFDTVAKKTRYFSGVVVEASWTGGDQHMQAYRLILRPWVWLLSQATDSRIFQKKSVVDIIKEVFSDAGFSDFDDGQLTESYPKIEYCVQYRESHLNFVLRLMEQFGIYYFFRHESGKHTMVLADATSVHNPIPDLPAVDFVGMGERTRDDKEFFREWASERRFRTGKVVAKAFDFDKPTAKVETDKSSPGGYEKGEMEVFLYPNKYKLGQESELGQKYVKATLESLQAQDKRRYASGNAPSIFPGGLTKLDKFKPESENQDYLVVSAQHSFVAERYRSGGAGGGGEPYQGHYVLQLKDRPFRAPVVTPKPLIYGPQTAVVVGPKDEEIYTDKHGRVKLQFHWDRKGKKDENSSRWVRVSQMWSGKQWGGFYIPRIGQEAVVEFIEGDPDRPLVVGTVYNGDNQMPAKMPKNQTQHGMKTRSSKGGGDSNYNELVFEDLKGAEFIRFHAEKDLIGTVENTEKRTIQGKDKKNVTPDKFARTTTIENGGDKLKIKDGGLDIDVSGGSENDKRDPGEISIHADKKIVLTVGPGKLTKIEMTPDGIKIIAPDIKTNSTAATLIQAGVSLDEVAGMIQMNCKPPVPVT